MYTNLSKSKSGASTYTNSIRLKKKSYALLNAELELPAKQEPGPRLMVRLFGRPCQAKSIKKYFHNRGYEGIYMRYIYIYMRVGGYATPA